jgi:hypothetical protein
MYNYRANYSLEYDNLSTLINMATGATKNSSDHRNIFLLLNPMLRLIWRQNENRSLIELMVGY